MKSAEVGFARCLQNEYLRQVFSQKVHLYWCIEICFTQTSTRLERWLTVKNTCYVIVRTAVQISTLVKQAGCWTQACNLSSEEGRAGWFWGLLAPSLANQHKSQVRVNTLPQRTVGRPLLALICTPWHMCTQVHIHLDTQTHSHTNRLIFKGKKLQ